MDVGLNKRGNRIVLLCAGSDLSGGQEDRRQIEDATAFRQAGPGGDHAHRVLGFDLPGAVQAVPANGPLYTSR